MKRVVGVAILILGILVHFGKASALLPNVLITEIQAGSSISASEEYVQVSNVSSSQVDLTGWKLEYFSASAKDFSSPSRTIALTGILKSGEDYIASSTNYKSDIARSNFSPTISATGGHLRLVSGGASQSQIDLVGWGAAQNALTSPAPALSAGQVLMRKIVNNVYINSGNNFADFDNSGINNLVSGQSANLQLTEILPNPAAPLTDASGEFIEIYNPNTSEVNLAGYKILTGASLNHSYTFKDQKIPPNSFRAFYSSETKVALTNSGGKVQLQDPSGNILDDSESYTNAAEGNSWAWDGQTWQWSTSPTPNAENIIIQPETDGSDVKVKSTSKASAKAKTSKPKATTASSKSKADGKVLGDSTTTGQNAMHPAVLAGVGGLALLYGAYEYRQDVINFFQKFRRDREARPKNR